jgi:hypothetical protein
VAAPKLKLAVTRDPRTLAPDALSTAELADEYGRARNALDLARPAYKAITDRCDALRAEAIDRVVNEPSAASTFFEGLTWRVEAGPKKFVAILPAMSKLHSLYKAVKKDFYGDCSVTLAAIERALGEPTFARIVTRTRTGARELTAVPRLPKAA